MDQLLLTSPSLWTVLAVFLPPALCLAALRSSLKTHLVAMTKAQLLEAVVDAKMKRNSISYSVDLRPHYEKRLGVEVIWQIPANPQGILFISHGWHGYPGDFWDPTPTCAHCSGLPEERAITLAALRRGYAVISIASAGAFWMKWPLATNRDMYNVITILSSWRKEHNLTDLPMTALGISDGGNFLSILALELKLSSVVLMISRGNEDAFRIACQKGAYPPTLFIEMPADKDTSRTVARHLKMLTESGISAAKVQCKPLQINARFFTERIPGLDSNTSANLFIALKENKYVDAQGYFVSPSPDAANWDVMRSWDWTPLVESLHVLPRQDDGSLKWSEAVRQELSLAFGFHCPTSLASSAMFDWLTGNTRCGEDTVGFQR